jgi:hypothetical protein
MFSRKLIGSLGFSHRGKYIDGRAASGGGPGGPRPGPEILGAQGETKILGPNYRTLK